MNRISPVWILTSLTGEAFDRFKEAIDQQFKAFSETELNGFVDCKTHQWWGVETTKGGLDGKWDRDTGYPNGIPAYYTNIFGLYNGQQGIVIYYSPLRDFTGGAKVIDQLNNDSVFFQTYGGNKFFYGLASFHKQETSENYFIELVKGIETSEKDLQLFNSITFLSDASHEAGANPNGYLSLGEDDYLALVVNTIFTIAITKRELHQLANGQRRLFNTAGIFSFTYEPDALKKSKAYRLSEQLLDAFCTNERDSEWYSQNDAKTHFDGSSLKQNLHWYNIYKLLSQGFEEESMKGLYPNCEISPWRMLAYELVPRYFKKHVGSLLRRLHDNVHNFSSLTTMRYEPFAKNKRKQMLDGSAEIENRQQFARTAIADYLSSVWDASYKGAKGVKQVILLVERTRDYLVKQKEEVDRVKAFSEPNDDKHKGFPRMEDYPLHEIYKKENEKYEKHYKEFVTNGEPPAENTEESDKSYEERQFSKLHAILKWHAMPLNLFTKAGLLSVLIFVTVWALISIIQATNMVHIFMLDTAQSLIALFVTTAIIVLVFAFVKYGLKTLRKIRLNVEKYIAWSYYRVQRELYGQSLKEEEDYYNELIKECDRIKSQLEDFIASKVTNRPAFGRYRVSKFQRDILERMDDNNPILSDTALNVELRMNGTVFSPDEVRQGLFDAMLQDGNHKLNDKMRDCVLREKSKDEEENVKEDLLGLWTETLADNIQVLINGQYGHSVDFPAFYGTSESNFTMEAWQSVNAIIYPSVYVYAMPHYSWTLSIVPNGDGYEGGDRWESMFGGPVHVDSRVPDFANVGNPSGWLTTTQIAVIMCVHGYNKLIVNGQNGKETTIFNN